MQEPLPSGIGCSGLHSRGALIADVCRVLSSKVFGSLERKRYSPVVTALSNPGGIAVSFSLGFLFIFVPTLIARISPFLTSLKTS